MDGGRYLGVIWMVYGLVSLGLTFFLARILFRSGTVFLKTLFSGNGDLARAVNGLLVVGFYLLSLGYAALLLGAEDLAKVRSGADAVSLVVNRLGVLLVSLAAIHFLNMMFFYWLGNRSGLALRLPPAAGSIGLGSMGARQEAPDADLLPKREAARAVHAEHRG